MKTSAVRLYGKKDLRLEQFELPPIKEDEILAKVVSDCICMSSHKAALQGADHKRVPEDVAENPIILGHEFSGELIEVGAKWRNSFRVGEKFAIQPNLNYRDSLYAPGYSYPYIGGNATYVIIPNEVMEHNCLLTYSGKAFFYSSLAEPISCIVGAFHTNYHTIPGSYVHDMGIVEGGNVAMLAGAGTMGVGAIDYVIHCNRKPGMVVVIDIDEERLDRASQLLTVEEAARNGVRLVYMNTDDTDTLLNLTGMRGYDDVFVFAPISTVIELGDSILGKDGCLNFFAGPTNPVFMASLNFSNVHYASTHVVGTSGGNTNDMLESISMIESGLIDPATMITHIGGLDCVIDATLNLDIIPGGKKLIYTHLNMPLIAIAELSKIDDPVFGELADIVNRNNGLWCAEAENFLLGVGCGMWKAENGIVKLRD